MLKPKIKISEAKRVNFERVIEGLIQSGFELYLLEGQTQVWIYLPEPDGFNISLNINGTWKLD